ncbi:radical SAM family heme chaperone HemW [Dehalogenimonas sp. THU2]|uniref:radical SAM family heme chaperone HemW n=1 Tax=Dehalogenimonas sp. THU2 TaxID=3151121 RepID=UPI0032184462
MDLSLYLHIPFCRRRCSYCSFYSSAGKEAKIPAYIEALMREIEQTRLPARRVNTIYFGGGTPSLLSSSDIGRILHSIHNQYDIADKAEITLEANPGTVDEAYLRSIRETGVNRLSLGIQTLDAAELKFLGRSHSTEEAARTIRQSRQAGLDNLNLDFIYGLPGRTIDKWDRMLDTVIGFGAEHLSLYGLTLEDDTPLVGAVGRGEITAPDADAAAEEYELAAEKLGAAGYRQYEISNWAHPGFESRHNTVYWRRGEYLGMGVAAHSFIGGERIANSDNLDEYIEASAAGKAPSRTIEVISQETALAEAVILGLRLCEGVSLDDIDHEFSIDLQSRFTAEIAELSSLGLVEIEDSSLRLTARGRLLGNEVFVRFLT